MLDYEINDREQKKKPNDTHFPISQQSGWGNGEPGKLHLSNFFTKKWYFNHTNWYLLSIKFGGQDSIP